MPIEHLLPRPWRYGYCIIFLLLVLDAAILLGCASMNGKKTQPVTTKPIPGQVILPWNGDPNVTFNVYRRSENGNDMKINSEPVKPLNAFTGGKRLTPFQYVDRTVLVGEEYYYTLEEIDKNGNTSLWESPRKMTATAVPDRSHSE